MKDFTGPFSHYIKKYLDLKRSLGFVYEDAEIYLYDFDRFLNKHFPRAKTVTRDMVVSYLKTTSHLSSATRIGRVTILRQFLRFLFQYNVNTYIPEKSLVPPCRTELKPHIYSKEEVLRIMEAAKKFSMPVSLRPHTYVTIIGLLWVTGLRIGEVTRLNNEDVDTERKILHIRQTKFYKSRIVPISRSTTNAMELYRAKRNSFCSSCASSPFFVNMWKKRLLTSNIQHTYHDLMVRLDMRTLQGGYPRLHDYRHAFATRWLADIYQAGKDPNAYLPIVATYLGHTNISSTQVYLHMSIDLLSSAGEKTKKYIDNNFKGVLR
ncbi:Tyrosine recombinase XerC [subsurface metagenome]